MNVVVVVLNVVAVYNVVIDVLIFLFFNVFHLVLGFGCRTKESVRTL